jgi:hypothetical protein
MNISGFLLGVLYAFIVGGALLLVGAVIVMIAKWADFAIDWNVQRIYIGVVLLVVIYYIAAALFGLPALRPFQ